MILTEHSWSSAETARGETPLGKIWRWVQSTYFHKLQERHFRSYFHWVTNISLCCDLGSGSLAAMHHEPSMGSIFFKHIGPWANLPTEAEGAITMQCSHAFTLFKVPAFCSSSLKCIFYCGKQWHSTSVIFRHTAQRYPGLLQGLDWNTLMLSY